ncbi:hypothetical protein CLIB1444_02S11122 [[Candida] jaroonii]|uniref:Uncharacterized protein n=1 Tax=[Candida] jaroonii TaxID=467808 RepID=A0ACA9Y4G0_9ASCO|nr:hypothetical protein CLIB1444_02S11122 [[Candida] jaroonii]
MLTDDIMNENLSHSIPDETIDKELFQLVKKIESKPGFDSQIKFDATKHLKPYEIKKKYTFKDFGIEKTHVEPVSEIAATDPFDFITEEAVDLMKWEIFHDKNIVKEFGRATRGKSRLQFQMSGFFDKLRFTKELWTSKEVQQRFNDIMGIELEMPHVFCMGHVNVSLADSTKPELDPSIDYEELLAQQDKNADQVSSALDWHYDSPPLVCVVMLSAPPNMIGGETGIKKGDESILRIPNSTPGTATVLQGRVIKHIATKPINNFDRISYVVSFVPKDPLAKDSTCATSERPGATASFTNDKFYPNYLSYRFERVEKRLESFRKELMDNYSKGEKFDQMKSVNFIKDIEEYLKVCYRDFEAISDEPYPPTLFSIPYSELPGK